MDSGFRGRTNSEEIYQVRTQTMEIFHHFTVYQNVSSYDDILRKRREIGTGFP
jgi:hypothetical protein